MWPIACEAPERRIDGRALPRISVLPQPHGTFMDSKTGKPFSLRHRPMNIGADALRRPGKTAKIDMRGDIGFAWIA